MYSVYLNTISVNVNNLMKSDTRKIFVPNLRRVQLSARLGRLLTYNSTIFMLMRNFYYNIIIIVLT